LQFGKGYMVISVRRGADIHMPREPHPKTTTDRGATDMLAATSARDSRTCGTPAYLDDFVAGLSAGHYPDNATPLMAEKDRECETSNFDPFAFTYYPRLKKVARFVALHYSEPLPLKRAANVAGLECTYFSRYFSERVGIGYLTWLGYLRVLIAIAIMTALEIPITDLAFAVGFRDLRTFQRAFVKYTGSTASAMRDRLEAFAKKNHQKGCRSQDLTHDRQFLTHIAQIVTRTPLPGSRKLDA